MKKQQEQAKKPSRIEYTKQIITALEDLNQQVDRYSRALNTNSSEGRLDIRRLSIPISPTKIIDFADLEYKQVAQDALQCYYRYYHKEGHELQGKLTLQQQPREIWLYATVVTPRYMTRIGTIPSRIIANFDFKIVVFRNRVWLVLNGTATQPWVEISIDYNNYKPEKPIHALIYPGSNPWLNGKALDPQIALQILKTSKYLFDPNISIPDATHHIMQITELVRKATPKSKE